MDFVCIGANDAVKTSRKTSIGGARNHRRRKTSVLTACAAERSKCRLTGKSLSPDTIIIKGDAHEKVG
jgi:hypothetical protein